MILFPPASPKSGTRKFICRSILYCRIWGSWPPAPRRGVGRRGLVGRGMTGMLYVIQVHSLTAMNKCSKIEADTGLLEYFRVLVYPGNLAMLTPQPPLAIRQSPGSPDCSSFVLQEQFPFSMLIKPEYKSPTPIVVPPSFRGSTILSARTLRLSAVADHRSQICTPQ